MLETAVWTEGEKLSECELVRRRGAAFVKTSTGFHPAGGATIEDVRLLRRAVGAEFGVKAAFTRAMIDAGANRIGTSNSAAILANAEP